MTFKSIINNPIKWKYILIIMNLKNESLYYFFNIGNFSTKKMKMIIKHNVQILLASNQILF